MGNLSSTDAIEEQTEMVSPGNAGVRILCTILTAASAKFLPDFFPITGPQDLYFIPYALCLVLTE